jgi:hypothetical protein
MVMPRRAGCADGVLLLRSSHSVGADGFAPLLTNARIRTQGGHPIECPLLTAALFDLNRQHFKEEMT